MKDKICRLCLETVNENYQEMEETFANILKLASWDNDLDMDTVTCVECRNNIQVLINLKSACHDMRERAVSLTDLKNYVSLDRVKIENTNNPKWDTGPKDEMRCRFCTRSTEEEILISLYESKENVFLMDILKKYIPELNSSNTEELLICKMCIVGMQCVSNFLIKCLDVEEKIMKYAEIKGVDYKGQIDLQDVQRFIFKPTLKFEDDSCHVTELTIKAEGAVECDIELHDIGPFIKTENSDIELEQSYNDSFQESSAESNLHIDHIMMYKCDLCTYVTTHKNHLDNHIFTHKNKFKCKMCAFTTKCKKYLTQHKLVHKSPSEVIMYKCENCPYETKRKHHLNRHKLLHKEPSEITKFKCKMCAFETMHKYHLKNHVLTHKSPSVVASFKCRTCAFETESKRIFNQHKLTHKSPSEFAVFKCEICTFRTKYKGCLNQHKLIHKSSSEITMFKCAICTVETKYKRTLTRHMLTHKDPSEVTKLKCEMCDFETIHKVAIKRHMMVHKSPSEATMYKCEICTFETNHKYSLVEHALVHKNPSEITMFKCEMCSFEAKRKRTLKSHMLKHYNPSLIKAKCEMCAFETIHKRNLKKHMLTHRRLPDGFLNN